MAKPKKIKDAVRLSVVLSRAQAEFIYLGRTGRERSAEAVKSRDNDRTA